MKAAGSQSISRRRRGASALFLVIALGWLGAACNSATSSTTSTTVGSQRQKPAAVYVVVGKHRVRVPTEIHGQVPNPEPGASQAGQQFLITLSGIHPSLLLATQGLPVVWTNLTNRPQRIIFTNSEGESGLIAPGGTYSMPTPRSESYTFKTSTGFSGVLNVDPNVPGLP